MKARAKRIIEHVIKILEEQNRPPQKGSWKKEIDQYRDLKDEKSLKTHYFSLQVIMTSQQAADDAMSKILVGTNVLTPALVCKGWKFWKQLDVNDSEKEEIEQSFLNWSNAKAGQLNAFKKKLEGLPEMDPAEQLFMMACLLDINCSCRQKLSDDLKKIVAKAAID